MTDIKVLSRDAVEINGEKWKRSYFESMSRVTPTGGNSACSKVGADEILRLMDAYEEPKESILKTNTSADHEEPAPTQVFYGGCTNTGAVETSEKPENPFKGPHWQEENFTKDIVFNAWRRDCDLRDELNRIRKLLAGKSVTP